MPALLDLSAGFANAKAAAAPLPAAVRSVSAAGIWSKRRDEISFDQLQKFWSELPVQARQELLRIDKQTLFEQARKNLYCSRCNGLLLESFMQAVLYGKSLQQEGVGMHLLRATGATTNCQDGESYEVQDPPVHPWGALSATKDGILTLLDCFIHTKSLKALQNVFDSARARERERELLYPDACGGGGRGWISQGMANYGRGHGTRETCALHTARLSCDTLVDFWSALGDETRSSLLRMKEDDFIERLMHRFDSKRFCRDCRRNVIREFKELKELKRMRREPRCTTWFCVADTAFQYEVFEDTVLADWHQSFSETDGTYHHFEWAIGTAEGKYDIADFEDVGMNVKVQINGLDLGGLSSCFITLRAWKLDGRCTELCVKAHALKGRPCVHRRLIVGDGFVTIAKGESIRSFFEHAEEAEEEDDDDTMEKDGNELDGDGSHPQKHAKSPELAREFLLDAATVIFKEQVEKAFREGTARQNAHSVFVSLALKLLEERVQVACKEIITLEKQTKLLEEEEKEKREEEERKERRRTKEREKKLRRKERLKGKGRERERKVLGSQLSHDPSLASSNDSPICADGDSMNIPDPRDEVSEEEDNVVRVRAISSDTKKGRSSSEDTNEQNLALDALQDQCLGNGEYSAYDVSGSFEVDQSKSSRFKLRCRKEPIEDQASNCYGDCQSAIKNDSNPQQDKSNTRGCMISSSRTMRDMHRLSRERVVNSNRSCNLNSSDKFHSMNRKIRGRLDLYSCGSSHQEDYRIKDGHHTARSGRDQKTARKTASVSDKQQSFYRSIKYNNGCYTLDSAAISKGTRAGGMPHKDAYTKQIWEPMDARRKSTGISTSVIFKLSSDVKQSEEEEGNRNRQQGPNSGPESFYEEHSSSPEKPCSPTSQLDTRNGYQNESTLVSNSDCYTRNGGDLETNAVALANSSSSDNCSCLSERDSCTSSLSSQNTEPSSTSDSEDVCQQSESRDGLTCTGNTFHENPEEPLENNSSSSGCSPTSIGEGTPVECPNDGQTKIACCPNAKNRGVNAAPTWQNLLPSHNNSMRMPPFPSATVGFHNQITPSWTPTNEFFPFAQSSHFAYPSHVGYGLPASMSPDISLHYNSQLPFAAPVFCVSQQSGYRTVDRMNIGSFNLTSSKKENRCIDPHACQNVSSVAQQIGTRCQCPPNLQSVQKSTDDAVKSQESPSFSLFHFGVPISGIASRYNTTLPSSKDERSEGITSKGPAAQAHSCSKEEAKMKEYNLFSSRGGATFSFL